MHEVCTELLLVHDIVRACNGIMPVHTVEDSQTAIAW